MAMALYRAAIVSVLLLAAPADAAVLWHSGLDQCWNSMLCAGGSNAGASCASNGDCTGGGTCTTVETTFWSGGAGIPTISTSVDSTAGNRCSLQFNPAASASLYRQSPTWTAADTVYATIRFKCASVPSTQLPLLTFYNTSSSKRGATLWVGPAALDASKFQLKVYYKNIGPSCTASHTMDGTPCGDRGTGASCTTTADCVPGGGVGADVLACQKSCLGGSNAWAACTTDADCPLSTCSSGKVCINECDETAEGESLCAPFVNAQSSFSGFSTGTWYLATLGHAKGTGQVTVSLWAGTAGGSPQSIPLGATTHKEGICSGGTGSRHLMACATNGDCTGTDTCDTSDVVQVNSVRLGSDYSTIAAAMDCTIDEVWVENSGPHPNGAIQTLAFSGQGSTGNWSSVGSAHSCGAGSEYQCLNDGTSPDSDTSAISDGVIAQPTIGLVVANAATPTAPLPSPTPLAVAVEAIVKNHTSSGTATISLDVGDDTGITAGSAFALSGLGDNGASGTYHSMTPVLRTTRTSGGAWTHAGVDALTLQVTRGGGASQTARMTSALASVLYAQADPAIPTSLRDHDGDGEITVCLAGDSTWSDDVFAQDVGAGLIQPTNVLICALGGTTIGDLAYDLDDILNGRTSQYMACRTYKGATGKKCDVLLVGPGANNFRQGNFTDPAIATALYGKGQSGYCDMKGGTGEGNSCSCPVNSALRNKSGARTNYWRLRNQYWKVPSLTCAWTEAACYSNADCGTAGICTSNVCQTNLGSLVGGCDVGATGVPIIDQCVPGCLNAPGCETGLCISASSDAYDFQQIQEIVTRAENYTWHPTVIPVTPSASIELGESACWFATQGKTAAYSARLVQWAKQTSRPFIDVYTRNRLACPHLGYSSGGAQISATTCLRDGIHKTTLGNAISTQPILECLTQSGGTSDGVCSGGTCSGGKKTAACSTNADCDTWRCPSF